MTPAKQQAIKTIEAMRDDATLDDIIYELHFKAQIEAGLKDLEDGRVISHEEVGRRLSKWLTK
ncbi:MAG: hypothetical protein HQM09_14670 [Candidatus Riflebacteria bacterium]|nr:hypothetical protein [Candidatus Riflebacteria bacterium]